jgi:hypothetical protein
VSSFSYFQQTVYFQNWIHLYVRLQAGGFGVRILARARYKVVQIWPGQTVTCLHTNSPGHIWTTLYFPLLQDV